MRWMFLFPCILLLSCEPEFKETSYDPKGATDTRDRPVNYQIKRTFRLDDGNISFSNDFAGARLNEVTHVGTDTFELTILPENEPINKSPWYAFQVWSQEEREVILRLSYPGFRHRYVPKTSKDGSTWTPVDAQMMNLDSLSGSLSFHARITEDTLWIAAQELLPPDSVYSWERDLALEHGGAHSLLGYSKLGKPIYQMSFGNPESQRCIFLMGRQHPPEVTGYFASQAFLTTLLEDNNLASRFRDAYRIVMVSMLNPDGIEHGHWRQSAGGVDLNRDWASFHQPETRLVRDFLDQQQEAGVIIDFAIDFHSTDTDMYYIFTDDMETHRQGFTGKWLDRIRKKIPGYEPDTEATDMESPSAKYYFFTELGAEFVTFEVGDETPREEVRQRAVAGAEAMMELLMKNSNS